MSTVKAYSTLLLPWSDVAQYATAIVSSTAAPVTNRCSKLFMEELYYG